MKRIFAVSFLLLVGCTATPISPPLAHIPEDCTTPGKIIRAEFSQLSGNYTHSYRVYLPPCFSAESESRYPVLYLVPGRGGGPDSWFAAGLAQIVDDLILGNQIPPFIIVATESIDSDPLGEIISNELIPTIEGQYPISDERRHHAVAGGSLGGIAAYRLAFQHPDAFGSAGIFGAGAISGEENRINSWLSGMTDENRVRVFMDCGDQDTLMLDRAEVMKSLLDNAGVENQLHVGSGGHNYTYWLSNFETYLKWMSNDWQ